MCILYTMKMIYTCIINNTVVIVDINYYLINKISSSVAKKS